jgi:DNA polymerase-4
MKSIGHEETYPYDLHDPADLRTQIVRLSDAVAARLRHHHVGARTVTLKVRFAGFQTVTRSRTVAAPLTTGPAISAVVLPMLEAIDPAPGVRLLGVSGSNLGEPVEQLSLDALIGDGTAPAAGATPPGVAELEHSWHDASAAVDDIRARFGTSAIGPAAAVSRGALRPVRTGAHAWGPDSHEPLPAQSDEDDRRRRRTGTPRPDG